MRLIVRLILQIYKEKDMPENKYAYDEESVKAIIEWAQTTQLPKEVML